MIDLPGTVWKIENIALGFKEYFLKHPEKRYDYEELAKEANPGAFPLSRVETKLKTMPLNFLSNTENDPFILHKTHLYHFADAERDK